MKKYFLDTNVILRFLLHDSEKYYDKARDYFEKAKNGKIEIIIIPEVFFEIDYVLRGVYSITKKEVCDIILKLLLTPYLNISDRDILITTVRIYQKINIDFFDIYLYYRAISQKGTVLSFDKTPLIPAS